MRVLKKQEELIVLGYIRGFLEARQLIGDDLEEVITIVKKAIERKEGEA